MRFRPLLTLAAVSTLMTFAAAPAANANWLGLPGLNSGAANWVREYATDSTLSTMYAATEDDGVFRSVTNGLTWEAFNAGLAGVPGAMNVRTVFTSGTTVYAGTTAGLFKSVAGGAFQPVAQGPEQDPKNPKKLNQAVQAVFTGALPGSPMLAAVASGGVYRSTDGGATWQKPAPGNGMLASETVWSLGSFKDNGALIYAATQSGIYLSVNGGSTWTLSNDGITGQTMRAWADEKYPNIYYAGTTDGLYRSINAGLTWTRISEDTTVRAITQFNGVEKKRLYIATDNGVIAGQTDLHPVPGKPTWRKLPLDGLSPNSEIWGLNSYINTPGTLLAGTHGGGGKVFTITPPVWAGVLPTINDTTPHKSQKLWVTSNGTWAGSPTEFTYQWEDCTEAKCVPITDATDATFVVPAKDRKYRVVVTAHNDFPNSPLLPAEKASLTTGAAAAEPNSLPGDIGGTSTGSIKLTPAGQPQPGVVLTAQDWKFNNPNATSVSWQWYRCVGVNNCEKLQGADEINYTLTDQDVGKYLCFKATGHNASGSKTLDCSGQTTEVLAPDPKQTGPQSISGNAWVGHTLLSGSGTWAYSGMRFERRWMRCNAEGGSCEYIYNEKSSTYVIKPADLGKRIKAEITADSNIANKKPDPAFVYTALTAVVTEAPPEPEPPAQQGGGGNDNGGGGDGTGGGGTGGGGTGGGGTGGGQTPPPPPGDKIAPVLSLKSGAPTSMKVTLSEAASLSVEYQRVRAGRKAGKKCKAGGKKGFKCTVVTKVATVKVAAAAGSATVKLPKRKLAKGEYRLVVTPVDAAGNKGAAKTVKFKVKK
ncbi:hypothetical protein DVA67_010850 [Solirubrobacter sp. CPCC 204708]|uniref:Photosynthesis system II assembly factor Ycf48/Hcf136-like domain-containing protein n=1 Tax=Solirubrobacter deserti TaxID=2282478 RepID=A0ABT4RHI4_9ACTN|nr:hypothetical protein [Solirubrobacter deserti]MBE2316476.1 hypothetical protein [Solirubrobacter deserti]MDA0138009.1 hypothetical protein [Solirubrobacter deserti]